MRPLALALLCCCTIASHAIAQTSKLTLNDNRSPAGSLHNGVLTLRLEITRGMWHPDREDDPGVEVIALAEAGKRASMPAPLIRVPQGTRVRTVVRNTLSESFMMHGLNRSHAMADSVRLQPGETREFELRADAPGNYVYGLLRHFRVPSAETPTTGNDMATAGAFIVDDAVSARTADRVFVINMMLQRVPQVDEHGMTALIATLNGRAWPHSERLTHKPGDTIVWRVLNASLIPHPMHLHGFYFDVLARGYNSVDSIYAAGQVRKAVTERLIPFSSMTMRWVPERAGNWLFHCHLPVHTALRAPLGPLKASKPHVHDALHGMSNLMMGVTVTGDVPDDVATRAQLRLEVAGGDSLPGDVRPRYRYMLNGAANRRAAGPTLFLQQNQPTAITVINRMDVATAVHWHGIELQSYHDGVAGFGGHAGRISPLIAPGDSFVARMTPPRAGTFIYHTHIDELRQMGGGLYGALLVLPADQAFDEQHERVIVLGSASDTAQILFNGAYQPDLPLEVGKTYRLRFVHIMIARPAMYVILQNAEGKPEQWTVVAKDGADLPEHQRALAPALQRMGNGETHDVLFTPRAAGTYRLEARAGNHKPFGYMTLTAR